MLLEILPFKTKNNDKIPLLSSMEKEITSWYGVVWAGMEGEMDAKQYCEILNEGVMESIEKLDMKEGERYFQQDNDPKHTFKLATTWFSDNDSIFIHWPAQSPDLNPIKHL